MGKLLTGKTSIDELRAATAPGFPRADLRVAWKPRAYPLPWINSWKPALSRTGWKELDTKRAVEAEEKRLCFLCGEPLGDLSIMGRHRASYSEEGTDGSRWNWITDGPPGHPRCLALAAEVCPHLRTQHEGNEDFIIAFQWEGPLLGYLEVPKDLMTDGSPRYLVRPGAKPLTLGELRALAEVDPLGDGL